jgi:hypothetical protein
MLVDHRIHCTENTAIRRSSSSYILGIFFALSIIPLPGAHADDGGKVMGTVKDPTGAVIPNAQVDLTNKATGIAQHTVTDPVGAYTFPLVSVGTYTLTVRATGFNPLQREGVNINIHSISEQDVTLQLESEAQTVTVDAAGAQVETAETELGETIESEKITAVPLNGRSYTDLLAVQAGVTPMSTSASQSGSRAAALHRQSRPLAALIQDSFP